MERGRDVERDKEGGMERRRGMEGERKGGKRWISEGSVCGIS
jgi:hypothetical protein